MGRCRGSRSDSILIRKIGFSISLITEGRDSSTRNTLRMNKHDTTDICAKIERMRAVGITARTAEDAQIAIVLAALALFSGKLEAVNE